MNEFLTRLFLFFKYGNQKIIRREIVHSSSLSKKRIESIQPPMNQQPSPTTTNFKKTPECGKKWFIKMFFFCPILNFLISLDGFVLWKFMSDATQLFPISFC